MIVDGRIDEAVQYINEFFPQAFFASSSASPSSSVSEAMSFSSTTSTSDPGSLQFALHCQWFVELIGAGRAAEALAFAESHLAPVSKISGSYDAALQVLLFIT